MSMMNTELYDALLSVNVPEMKARKAAESILSHEQVVTKTGLAEFRAEVIAEMLVLKWMVGVNMALTLGLILHAIG